MNRSDLQAKLIEEIQLIPEDELLELYDLVHSFRLRSQTASTPHQNLMKFAGCWNDLPTETFTEFLEDLSQRRQQAFSQRQNREASLD